MRYQVSGPEDADHILLLVHGLFVNSDHWRKTLTGLQSLSDELNSNDENSGKANKTYRIYALDLLGSGWSSKPFRDDPNAQKVNGENGRFNDCDSVWYREQEKQSTTGKNRLKKIRSDPIM